MTERDHLALGFRLFAVFRVHIAVGGAGMHQVNGNAARAQIARQAAGEGVKGRLGHRVNGNARHRHAVRQTAADVDDAPAVGHVHQRFLNGDHHAANVDVDQRIDVRQGHGLQRAAARDTRVVDQNVQPAKGTRRMGDGILNRLRAGAVGLNRFAVPPKRLNFIGDRLGFIGGFFIRNNHIGTGACQRQRDSPTQSTAGAGNQRLFTC